MIYTFSTLVGGKWSHHCTKFLTSNDLQLRQLHFDNDLHFNNVMTQFMSAGTDYQDTRRMVTGIYPHPMRFCDVCHPGLQICSESMQQQCAFTIRLFHYIITGTYQGQNVMEFSEGIASISENFYETIQTIMTW